MWKRPNKPSISWTSIERREGRGLTTQPRQKMKKCNSQNLQKLVKIPQKLIKMNTILLLMSRMCKWILKKILKETSRIIMIIHPRSKLTGHTIYIILISVLICLNKIYLRPFWNRTRQQILAITVKFLIIHPQIRIYLQNSRKFLCIQQLTRLETRLWSAKILQKVVQFSNLGVTMKWREVWCKEFFHFFQVDWIRARLRIWLTWWLPKILDIFRREPSYTRASLITKRKETCKNSALTFSKEEKKSCKIS